MARTWTDVRRDASEAGLVDDQRVAAVRGQMQDEISAFRLAEIRKRLELSQQTLASGMQVSQARVSTIERGQLTRIEIGTLQAYVEALGGHLRIVVDFPDETLALRD